MFVGVFVGVNVGVKKRQNIGVPRLVYPRRVGLYSLRSRSLANASLRPNGLLSLTQNQLYLRKKVNYATRYVRA